jgi:hypothetical protein
MAGRKSCEYLKNVSMENYSETEPCGQPAVDQAPCFINGNKQMAWLCAEHYDWVMWLKASAKKVVEEFKYRRGIK